MKWDADAYQDFSPQLLRANGLSLNNCSLEILPPLFTELEFPFTPQQVIAAIPFMGSVGQYSFELDPQGLSNLQFKVLNNWEWTAEQASYYVQTWRDECVETLQIQAQWVENTISRLSKDVHNDPLRKLYRRFRKSLAQRICRILKAVKCCSYLQEPVLTESDFFEYHGFGRPPRPNNRDQNVGLLTGRICSSPTFA